MLGKHEAEQTSAKYIKQLRLTNADQITNAYASSEEW